MNAGFLSAVLSKTVVDVKETKLCSLWAGYGSIKCLTVRTATDTIRLICKEVNPPKDTGVAHERKVTSYLVEIELYKMGHLMKVAGIAIPDIYHLESSASGKATLLMSDLRVEYPIAGDGGLDWPKTLAAVDWLANFHAFHWERSESLVESKLWPEGCYWRLDTRQKEYEDIGSEWLRLKNAAFVVADLLKNGTHPSTNGFSHPHKTLVHGDYKSPNLQFACTTSANKAETRQQEYVCAAVDFQYCGGGYGVRDVGQLIVSSCDMPHPYNHEKALALETAILEYYYAKLLSYLKNYGRVSDVQYSYDMLTKHYELCLVDYVRFMAGWGMWGNTEYAERRTEEILSRVDGGSFMSSADYDAAFRKIYCS